VNFLCTKRQTNFFSTNRREKQTRLAIAAGFRRSLRLIAARARVQSTTVPASR